MIILAPIDRDLRSGHGWSRCVSEPKAFSEAAARICGYVEIYRGIYVNPPVQRSDLHKSSLPINLQVNPDRSTEIAMEKKTGSPQSGELQLLDEEEEDVVKNPTLLIEILLPSVNISIPIADIYHRTRLIENKS